MGFAGAFASGLVKGFHQNILNEQKARATEDAKLDSYEAMIFKTSMEGGEDVNTSAINKISNLVKDGRKQLDSRGSIDIFGRPGNRLKLDMLNTAGIVNNTNSTLRVGGVQMPVVKAYNAKTIRSDPAKRALAFFDSLNKLGPEGVNKLFTKAGDKEALGVFYKNAIRNYLRPIVLSEDGKELVTIVGKDSINSYSWMQNIVGKVSSNYQLSVENLTQNGKFKKNNLILPLQNMPGKSLITTYEELQVDSKQQQILNNLALHHGYNDKSEFIYDASRAYSNKGEFITGLNHTLNLFERNAHQPKSQEEKEKIGEYIVKEGLNNDPLARAYMFAPLLTNKENVNMDFLRENGFVRKYKEGDFNNEFKKFSGKSLVKFEEGRGNLVRTKDQLKRYVGFLKQAKLKPNTTVSGFYNFVNSILGTGGAVDQVTNLMASMGVDKDSKEGKNIFTRLSKSIEDLPEGSLQAKISTLKFVIAADLARAEDSQGRLSDQDLARNLAKLGDKTFTTIPGALAAIEEIQLDIDKKLENVDVMNDIMERARGRGYFDKNDRRLLQADRMSKEYVEAYYRKQGFTEDGTPDGITSTIEDVNNLDKFEPYDSSLQGPDGETVHESKEDGSLVLVKDGVVVRQISKENKVKATKDGTLSFINVGVAQQKSDDDIKGQYSPFGPDANPNVSQGNVSAAGKVSTGPNVAVPNPPAAVTQNVFTGDELGVTISTLGSADASGHYTIGPKKYRIKTTSPLTLELVTP